MTQLNEIIFINSASLNYAQVKLDGNTLLCGANGVGKTTILRAVLYFYGANSKKLGINSSKKKVFSEYYFENLNSYIIYKYKNIHGIFYVMLYKTGHYSSINFKFFTSYKELDIKDIFIKENNALSVEKIFKNFRLLNIEQTNIINTTKEYKHILYGQNKQLKQYALINANKKFEQIHKTISNIFVNSKLDSNVIKKSLVSDIEDFIPINLNNINSQINRFLEDIDAIYDLQKNTHIVKEIIKNYNNYYKNKDLLKDSSQKLYSIYLYSKNQYKTIQEYLNELKKQNNDILDNKDILKNKYNKINKKLENELLRVDDFIKLSKEKHTYYIQNNIDEKLEQYSKKDIFIETKKNLQSQLDILNKNTKEKSLKYDRLIEQEKNSANKLINNINFKINQLKTTTLEYINKANIIKQNNYKKNELYYNPKIEEFKNNISKKEIYLVELSHKKDILEKTNLFYDDIKILEKSIQNYKDEINLINFNIQKEKTTLSKYEHKIININKNCDIKINNITSTYENEKKDILLDIKLVKKRLDINEESFLNFLYSKKHPKTNYLTSILKDDILLSQTLNPKIINNNDNLYGISIDIDIDNIYEKNNLKNQLNKYENDLKNLLNRYNLQKESIKNSEDKQIKEIYKDKKIANNNIENLDSKLHINNIKLNKEINKLDNLNQKEIKEKNIQITQLIKLIEDEQIKLNNFKLTYSSIKKEFLNKKQNIKSIFTKSKNEYTNNEQKQIILFTNEKNNIDEDLIVSIKNIENLKINDLNNSGVDIKSFSKIDNEIKYIKNILDDIQNNEEFIFGYKKDKDEYFDKVNNKKDEQKQILNAIKYEKENFDEKMDNITSQITNNKQKQNDYTTKQSKYNENIKEYEKIENSNFFSKIRNFFNKDIKIEKYEDISTMQTTLFNIDDECTKELRKLKSNLNKIFSNLKLNNVLNLTAPKSMEENDILFSAKEIKIFDQENKIKYFKEQISSRYSMSLSLYTKQISQLLDASHKIKKTILKINNNLSDLKNINVIQKIELRYEQSDNKVVQLLKELKDEYNSNSYQNDINLFNPLGANDEFNDRILKLFKKLNSYLFEFNKKDILDLEDSFVLEFRAIENGNDTGFVSILDDIGSNGTDVMVKVMVYISMLNLSKNSSINSKNEDIYLHCILDEIGILSPKYLKELILFANSQKIQFLNGAPDEKIVSTYKRIYLLSTNKNHKTLVNEIISQV